MRDTKLVSSSGEACLFSASAKAVKATPNMLHWSGECVRCAALRCVIPEGTNRLGEQSDDLQGS